jgi:hypothetical protein
MVMHVRFRPESFDLDSARKGHVLAVGAEFEFSFDEEPTLKSETEAPAAAPGGDTDDLEQALAQAGFRSVIPLVFDDIHTTEGALALAQEGSPDQGGFALISTSMAPDEDLVLLEFNPGTGEVLDWYLPIPDDAKANVLHLAAGLPSETHQPGAQLVVFRIPLYARYTSEPQVYSFSAPALPRALKKKVFKLFSLDKVERFISDKIGDWLTGPVRFIDRKLVKHEVLGLLGRLGPPKALSAVDEKRLRGKRGLLFVHGIISSSVGAFGALQDDTDWYDTLSRAYDGNLLAYDHWTLSKDIAENARELAERLPEGMTLNIMCHSRGAGVVRSLLEREDIRHLLVAKGVTVRKVVFVAGACEGSNLATDSALENIVRVLNKMGILLGVKPLPAIVVLQAIKLVLSGLQKLPGTESMNPSGELIAALRDSKTTLANEYGYIRANYDPPSWSVAAADHLVFDITLFAKQGNDCIVPFAGAGVSDTYLREGVKKTAVHDFGSATDPDDDVWHITFFRHARTKAELIAQLTGTEAPAAFTQNTKAKNRPLIN